MPAFSAALVLTLALGIGANTAIFSAVYGVLIQPFATPHIEQLATVITDAPGLGLRNFPLTPGQVDELGKHHELFTSTSAFTSRPMTLTGIGEAQRVIAFQTIGSVFDVFSVQPRLGRFFQSGENQTGRNQVAVLSYGLWQRLYGGEPCLGRKLQLDGDSYEIVGVAPDSFAYPRSAELWTPMPEGANDGSSVLEFAGRMQAGISPAQLDFAVHQIAAEMQRTSGGPPAEWKLTMIAMPFLHHYAGELRPVLWVLMATVVFVLLIACANVAGLMLVRTTNRSRELAMRSALGASSSTLIWESLTECLLLSLAGGLLGVFAADASLDALRYYAPPGLPVASVALNRSVLLFSAAISLIAGLLFGLAPSWRAAQTRPAAGLVTASRSTTAGRGRHRTLNTLAMVQIALAVVLLTGSGLLIRTLFNLLATDPGFRIDHTVTARYAPPASVVDALSFHTALLDHLRAVPGVQAAALVNNLPFAAERASSPFQIPSHPAGANPAMHADRRIVSTGYFEALGILVMKGRPFNSNDRPNAPPVVLINDQLAKEFFPGEDPLGKIISQGKPAQIIGVVASGKHADLAEQNKAAIYYPLSQNPIRTVGLVVRTTGEPAEMIKSLRHTVALFNPNVPLYDVQTLAARVETSLSARRLAMVLMTAFAGLALFLAILGIYGVISYSTRERTREIGIRMALGAEPAGILRMILSKGAILAAGGIAAGLAASFLLARFLRGILFGVPPTDPLVLTCAAGLLCFVALIACYLPARRAAKVEPAITLHQE